MFIAPLLVGDKMSSSTTTSPATIVRWLAYLLQRATEYTSRNTNKTREENEGQNDKHRLKAHRKNAQ
jgi:hypothetical protein